MPSKAQSVPDEHYVERAGNWLPEDHRHHREWLSKVVDHVDNNPKDWHPVIKAFEDLIENDTRLYMLFNAMFIEVPAKAPYDKDPTGQHHEIRDHKHLLAVLNHLLTVAPEWNEKNHAVGLVGLPIYALLDWPMGTSAGFAAFLDPRVNAMLKKVLQTWSSFLQSPDSAYCLSEKNGGWLGDEGKQDLTEVATLTSQSSEDVKSKQPPFHELFMCDPSLPSHGFTSWDDFFTRRFRSGGKNDPRPVAGPGDQTVIANSCESKPFNLAHNVSAREKFWLKSQPYSVLDMLDQDPLASKFIGGTVYQAFLSSLSYHRWHSPISGKVIKTRVIDGTYYSEPFFTGFTSENTENNHEAEKAGQGTGQGFLSAVATRALIFIDSGIKGLGIVCVVAIGMCEVSSCDVTVREGQEVQKGDEIGMFHFGGSTHCVMFEKGVKVSGFPETGRKENVPVRSKLCVVDL